MHTVSDEYPNIGLSALDNAFFIVGCQRSGTTVMKLIMECHPEIQCYDEHLGYKVLAGKISGDYSRSLIGFKVPRLTEQFGVPILRDHDLPPFPNFYKGQKLVFMIRDVRDTVVSMFKLRYGSDNWFEKWGLPALLHKFESDPRFRQRYGAVLAECKSDRNPMTATAALYWKYKVDALFDYLELGYPVQVVRYEDLVSSPESQLHQVCTFLGVDWDPALLRHHEFHHGETWGGLTIGGTNPKRPMTASSLGQWREYFSSHEVESIMRVASVTYERLY